MTIILVDSLDRASNDQPILEGAPNEVGTMEGAPNEVDTPLEERIPTGGPSNVDEIGEETPSRVAATLMLPPKPVDTGPSRKRLPN